MKKYFILLSLISFSAFAQYFEYTDDQLLHDLYYGGYVNCSIEPEDIFYKFYYNNKDVGDIYLSSNKKEMKILLDMARDYITSRKCRRDESVVIGLAEVTPDEILNSVRNGVYSNCSLKTDSRYTYISIGQQAPVRHFSYEVNKIERHLRIAISKEICKRDVIPEEEVFQNVLNQRFMNCTLIKADGIFEFYVNGKLRDEIFPFRLFEFKKDLYALALSSECMELSHYSELFSVDPADKIYQQMLDGKYQNCFLKETPSTSQYEVEFHLNGMLFESYKMKEIRALKLYLKGLVSKGICAK